MQGTYTGPMRFVHRGLAQAAPENTLGAFQGAVDGGYEGIEIDIQLTKDGEVVVAHDKNFTRMTLGRPAGVCYRSIRDMTWEEIASVEIPYANHLLSRELPDHSDVEFMSIMPERLMGQEDGSDYETALARDGRMARLMRFADFDQWFSRQAQPVTVEIEVKAAGVMPRMLEILEGSPNLSRYILFSGVPDYNREIQSALRAQGKPEGLRLGANIRFLNEETKRFIQEMDLFEVGLNAEAFSREDVQWLANRGIFVLSNLGDYPAWWAQLEDLGVLGFKTNFPEAYSAWWLAEHGGADKRR
ncbi:glycerophosphodiester phosphodiesterase family protein [uncultured Oscillibacter sp.]|uniref:glycerophosphodiester phosphodiesterase family protein n=1 Tax=uncultured Oscillibacter sp. TaxID=876091 RepID=UPI00261C624A|nr:glycerophosphodiester phosphodiesterase family protein [uncultured Oscillibacter sp.]